MIHRFSMENDHFQVLVGDRQYGPTVDTVRLWSGHESIARVSGVNYLFGLATVRFGGSVNIEIDIVETEPHPPSGHWELMGGVDLEVPSGEIVAWSPESSDFAKVPTVTVAAGRYTGIAYRRNAEGVTDELAMHGPDEYRVTLWPT